MDQLYPLEIPKNQQAYEAPLPQSQPTAIADPHQARLTPPLPSMTQVAPGIFLGNLPSIADRSLLEENNIKGIVSLGTGRWNFWNLISHVTRDYVQKQNQIFVPCVDSRVQNLLVYMEDVCDFMDRVFASMSKDSPGGILVHCDRGVSRSATAVIAYLMRKRGQTFEDAFASVQAERKVNPNANFREQLRIWQQVGYKIWENREAAIPKPAYQVFINDRAAEMEARGVTGREPLEGLLANLSLSSLACKSLQRRV
jgi:dual specificity phosphatase 12